MADRADGTKPDYGSHPGAVIRPYRGIWPTIHPTAYIAPGAVILGDVEIGPGASVWYGCVLRADTNRIVVGEGSNVQDGTVVHCESDKSGDYRETGGGAPCIIGRHITIGHMALLHACVLEDGCLVGMRAVVMDEAVVEAGGMVAAGALVPPRKRVTTGEIWAGSPAKALRPLTEKEVEWMAWSPRHYAKLAQSHKANRED